MKRSTILLPLLLCACPKPGDETALPHDTDDTADTAVDDGLLGVTILHTNDWQSHMLGWGPNAEYSPDSTDDDGTFGGLARTATLVQEIRDSSTHPVVLLDAGDWMSGSLFQLLATSHAVELQVAQAMGYDAMTIGNHEYDWGPGVLGDIIATGDAQGVTVPLVAANIVPSSTDPADDSLAAHLDSGRIVPSLVLTLDNGLEIGIFGLLGDEAASVAPASTPTSFDDPTQVATDMVAELEGLGVDLVLGLTHAGVTEDVASSPDELMADEVPGIDVIVGGHSHTPMGEYRVADQTGTVIVQAGAYTAWLGQLDLAYDGVDWVVEGYTLHTIDDSIPGDPTITGMVDGFLADLEAGPLAALGLEFDAPVAAIPADMPLAECSETALGNLITDAFMDRMNQVAGDPIDFSFESQGVIRDGLSHGTSGVQAFSDIFRVLPLGFGTDDVPGYGLVDFYVTASELLDTCEVTASISPSYGCSYFIEVAGMRCNLDMERSQFNRARSVDAWIDGAWVELDTSGDELYHVAVDSYVASLMGILESLTYGAIVITPKDASGQPYTSTTAMLFDADPGTDGVQELKLWQALMGYAGSFEDDDGDQIPDLPASYATPAGRIVGWE
jgi:5'-nucleotidase/UDP-sugar diphosphatase